MFHLEKDCREYSSFGTVCLNEGIKEISGKKNVSSSSFSCKIGLNK